MWRHAWCFSHARSNDSDLEMWKMGHSGFILNSEHGYDVNGSVAEYINAQCAKLSVLPAVSIFKICCIVALKLLFLKIHG